jgi:hypothetical protein
MLGIKAIAYFVIVLINALPLYARAPGVGIDYGPYARVLDQFVDERGLVAYEALRQDGRDLRIFTTSLSNMSPRSHPSAFPEPDDRLAYWINAYNALVLKGVVDAYPVKSVKDIKEQFGFFSQTYFTVGGQRLSLNDIEHKILRKEFGEPRIHAAINCASIGCPRLLKIVYEPSDLDAQLNHAMKTFVREQTHIVRIKGEVILSKIFDWFRKDFTVWMAQMQGNEDTHILDYVGQFLEEQDRKFVVELPRPRVRFSDYDWKLNDQNTVGER